MQKKEILNNTIKLRHVLGLSRKHFVFLLQTRRGTTLKVGARLKRSGRERNMIKKTA